MEFHFVLTLILTWLPVAINQVQTPEVYWQSLSPNTPMPKALRDLLPSEQKSFEDNAISIDIGGVGVDVGKGVSVDVQPPFIQDAKPFLYTYGASEYELITNRNVTLFFLYKDLHPGTKMNLYFTKFAAKTKFLPRQVAQMIPFSSNKFSEVLHKFSIKPNSTKAEIMRKTIEECEEPALLGEDKYCATSLEAMVDFGILTLGKNVQALATQVDKEDTQHQEFSIIRKVRLVGSKIVACHFQNYIYPVFYCHKTCNTKAYMVPLVGADKTQVSAVAVCHTDTSKWNPMHLAFQVLKVEPGTVPICHFLPEGHIVWVAN
ncbi:hypothetical protein JCGZ_07237 [Jatropha curcas]|uniref:BURP domain-containing protein n=1 Tax=Jatropha curcas TaxID=180498 RepID=A0A067KBR7_JATCU|nr:BURP domain protein RD22 [Jatropha curcas]KDP33666.1 hypothetical protein JCGZ_07237 [Jatropha curcas]